MGLATTYQNYANTWWTPPAWTQWAEDTLGGKYFDPCPQGWGEATHKDGLRIDWGPRTYCNHPGARGSTKAWWKKSVQQMDNGIDLIWCAFSAEQFRHMQRPSPKQIEGWLIEPLERVAFIWGGPDMVKGKKGLVPREPGDEREVVRAHGVPAKSPGNWTIFWSTKEPAPPPVPCLITPTGNTELVGAVAPNRKWV